MSGQVRRKRCFDREGVFCVEDSRRLARKRLPGFIFDFLEGAAGDETTARRNLDAFASVTISPRLRSSMEVSTNCKVFGQSYAAPFGIAPLGLAELVTPKADLILAQAAARSNIPYICSAAAGTSIEEISRETGRVPWFQLYSPSDPRVAEDILTRVECAGVDVLIVTVDVPAPGKRLRDLRNGLKLPLRPSRRIVLDSICSPAWAMRQLRGKRIGFPHFEPHMKIDVRDFHHIMASQTGGVLDWNWLERLRERWSRKLVIKGLLCASDAARAHRIGIDGLVVSNHGGRQFDGAPASLSCLADIKAAASASTVMLDSGIRSGTDVAKALTLGAAFTWIGRPFLYALAALGEEGPAELIQLLLGEFRNVLTLAGGTHPEDLCRPREGTASAQI